jgi:methylenetetrahydrofolate dehydrogenase (NADP+)/methenyltetrahydrofolate cyclohydrolase
MPATLLDGNRLAEAMRAEIAAAGAAFTAATGTRPGLATVRVGDDPASARYVRSKIAACQKAGFASFDHHLPADTPPAELLALIARLNADPAVHGILVQLPLPPQMDESAVIHAIAPLKDVDAFHPENVGLLTAGHPRFLPCTPHGILHLLRRNGVALDGARAMVIGRSNIVGKPLALLLMQKPSADNPEAGNATVTVAHRGTRGLADLTRSADLIVAAAGQVNAVTADMVRPGAVVVDVGMNRSGGRLVGDVDFEAVRAVAGAITPVPGGVGPMTVTMLLHNTLLAAKLAVSSRSGSA